MSMYCDLHGIDRDLRTEVRVCDTRPPRQPFSPFIVVELRAGDGCVQLFLSPDQALNLAKVMVDAVQDADTAGGPDAEALPEREGA